MKTDDFTRLVKFDCDSFIPPSSDVCSVHENVVLLAFYSTFKPLEQATRLIESYFNSFKNIDRIVFLTPNLTIESTVNYISHYFLYNNFNDLNKLYEAYENCDVYHTSAFVFGLTSTNLIKHRAVNYFNILDDNWQEMIRKILYAKK